MSKEPADGGVTEATKDGETPADTADGDGTEAEAQAPSKPSHEPFTVKLLSIAKSMQMEHGLRHNDHLRYRQYGTRRLRRLYIKLKFKHGTRGKFKQPPFPDDFSDPRFLEVLLVQAERAWSYGMQLKSDNATASVFRNCWRRHSIRRFGKAKDHARKLQEVCKVHGDQRTQLEADAYFMFMEGTWLMEKEEWKEALRKLVPCHRAVEHLGLASEHADSQLYKAKAQDLEPLIRECKYNFGGFGYQGEDEEDGTAATPSVEQKNLSNLSYRGHALAISSDEINWKLMRCSQLLAETQVNDNDGRDEIIQKYNSLKTETADALTVIHSNMIAAGTEGQAVEWRMVEAFARELSASVRGELECILLEKHLQKIDGVREVNSVETLKQFRPDEGMRMCDVIKETIQELQELPETSEAIARTLATYLTIAANCRCLFLAICHCALGKLPEAASLMDMLHARVDDVNLCEEMSTPIARIHRLFDTVQKGMPLRVGQWRCRALVHLCTESTKTAAVDDAPTVSKSAGALEEISSVAPFPPRFRDIPCKPLLFDLAYQCLEQPDIDEIIAKGGVGGDNKGSIIGRVASGLGGRLGGLFGGRR
jgi:signal recognition particle subunit SRP68|eukprot:TRINITY_DN52254_c0_g1_i1.p1 TRINITY_DN52254_c0_g1~~TRINITY_DN52254_c0_g1_i1.p1  ORF type:complete len:595 (-),score=88.39 TRINITY_DN52254_c0_g1_i1:398-2182(-)